MKERFISKTDLIIIIAAGLLISFFAAPICSYSEGRNTIYLSLAKLTFDGPDYVDKSLFVFILSILLPLSIQAFPFLLRKHRDFKNLAIFMSSAAYIAILTIALQMVSDASLQAHIYSYSFKSYDFSITIFGILAYVVSVAIFFLVTAIMLSNNAKKSRK